MKIICDSCGTKYSISDDKVRGKVFKIRCKKCSHIIVVRGGEGQEEAAAAPAAAAAEGGWHIVVEGEQVGPIPEADVRARIERGEIRSDTYIWKEGFADWLKLSAVPEFSDLVPAESGSVSVGDVFASDSAAPQPTNGTERSGGRRRSGANRPLFGDGGADVFAAPAAAAPSSGGDLFGAHSSSSSSSSSNWPSSGGGGVSMAGHDGGRVENLTGQRHENSVLFSLSNLQSLAMPAAKPSPSVNLGSAPAPTTEGSGLIDIRAMAASTRSLPSDGSTTTSDDDLPAFGAFSPAAPVLLPMPSSSGPPWWIWLVIIGMLGVVGVVGYAAFRVISPKEVVVVKEVQVPAPAPAPTKAGGVGAKATDEKPSTIAEKDLPPREGATPGKEGEKGSGKEKGSHHAKGASGSKEGKKPIASAEGKKDLPSGPVPGEPPKPKKGSLEDLLNDAAPKAAKSGPRVDEDKKGGGGGEGPGPLPKNALVAGLKGVQPKINACYNQFKVPGTAMVTVVIGKSGKVTSAAVTGKFAGTPTGQCVEAAVKTASFPPSDGFTTPYPFQLK
jgi:predicted Zn finger-like uncharacterized protein